jgi:predicted  nucleic acid-binding Zn-ribbon protein
MIFKDASDCVQRNQELMTQLRHLSSQLHEKTTEALAAKDSISQLNDKLAESASLIRDHNEMIQVLELRYVILLPFPFSY